MNTEDDFKPSLGKLFVIINILDYNGDHYFVCLGDNRVNEQIALGVFHTLAVREHNNIASKLANINPLWSDEKLYQVDLNWFFD